MKWILYSDGASRGNPGDAGAGALLTSSKGDEYSLSVYLGQKTNNQAEYEALIIGLEKLKGLKAKDLEIRADSELLVKQLNGEYKVKNPDLLQLFFRVKELLGLFEKVSIKHIPREKNKRADKLANEAIDEAVTSH